MSWTKSYALESGKRSTGERLLRDVRNYRMQSGIAPHPPSISAVIPAKAGIRLFPSFAPLREIQQISRKDAKARRTREKEKAVIPPSREWR
jgi:hypothetical protein